MLRAHMRLFVVLIASVLWSCDMDLFGHDEKKIGPNYALVKVDWPGEFDSGAPDREPSKTLTEVTEIGWQKPLILVRGREKEWRIIDTVSGEVGILADEQRRSQPRYSSIEIYAAAEAWRLPRKKREW